MLLTEKWKPVLDHQALPKIVDGHRKAVLAQLLENQESASRAQRQALFEDAPTNSVGTYPNDGTGIGKFDPVMIALVRRSMPQLMAYDVCGVQPLKQPTGLIFAMRAKYGDQATGTEALVNEADTDFSGTGTHAGSEPTEAGYTTGAPLATAVAEAKGSAGNEFKEMSITIERLAVEAKSRALKAEYSLELAQDLKALHGLDADNELSNILSTEITAEINREVIRTIYTSAVAGAQGGSTATPGTFDLDVDSNGRWSVERFKGLLFQLEREANAIGQQTRRGRGNFVIVSADVAAALSMAGKLDHSPALKTDLNVDDSSGTFAGTLNGKLKVYIDPYSANVSANQFAVMGYKGTSAYDAGIFYCPYIPLQLVRAVDPDTFQPKLGFKTRYGMVANPFAEGTNAGLGRIVANTNKYFRRIKIAGL